jgi:hypothetical protein
MELFTAGTISGHTKNYSSCLTGNTFPLHYKEEAIHGVRQIIAVHCKNRMKDVNKSGTRRVELPELQQVCTFKIEF